MELREIVTRTERIWLEDGIVRCVVLPTATHTLNDAHENSRAVDVLAAGRRLPMLLDTRDSRGIDRDARLYYVRPEAANRLSALAMLIDSQIGRIFGNFYTNVHRPPFPLRLFDRESDAVAWLKEQVV
ncbi:DUF7793 family protein [Nannocystis radixulma]|uniref:DUF7793 domain-containing protein n=1 Tax=Nannocystis radixulma TaxID=2995305 RepID=A0ABT5AYM7_9BACT|nr:hypothetical protein [Nannocystis radixulma]MDC0666950.1 hypothetical protein [Nannocystis radixulma]